VILEILIPCIYILPSTSKIPPFGDHVFAFNDILNLLNFVSESTITKEKFEILKERMQVIFELITINIKR
jgi:hypothetical protein